ncbi:dTMP kinase [Paenibacillus senegalimassiliensis]|uniref:dTMP kinase n=1 Tax=Paenibacillus senegalimassiliensis TaxID=1737426 RepID=UPI00073F99B3|nr:dTMP kinase [Paenibacillus senegalimassiliensis]
MNHQAKGLFITLEGGDGSGKTTVMREMEQVLREQGVEFVTTREPGGIEIAEKIRSIILNPQHTAMDARTEALLYAASRRQHLAEKVEPSLDKGITVLCDRFLDSSLAYQGYARGLGMDEVLEINLFATKGRFPDLTFYLDITPEAGLARIASSQSREVNRLDMESLQFHQKVREGYLLIAEMYPERIRIVDASLSKEQVAAEIRRQLSVTLKDFMI